MRIKVLIEKELRQLIHEKYMILGLILVPFILLVVVPFIVGIIGINPTNIPNVEMLKNTIPENIISAVPKEVSTKLAPIYLFYRYLFLPIILMVSVMLSNIIASYSFVGEKEKKTIEALLYTPVNLKELILGKLFSAAIPSLFITWIFSLLYTIVANYFSLELFGIQIFPNLEWIFLLVLVVPTVNFLSIILVILASQRLKSSKSAQSVSMIIVFPMITLVVLQLFGLFILEPQAILIFVGLLILTNILLLRLASKRFNLEKYILNI